MIHKNRYNRRKIAYTKGVRKIKLLKERFNEKDIRTPKYYSKVNIGDYEFLVKERCRHIGGTKYNRSNTWKIGDRKNFERCEYSIKEYAES